MVADQEHRLAQAESPPGGHRKVGTHETGISGPRGSGFALVAAVAKAKLIGAGSLQGAPPWTTR